MLFILDYSLISEQMFDKIDSKVLLHIDGLNEKVNSTWQELILRL